MNVHMPKEMIAYKYMYLNCRYLQIITKQIGVKPVHILYTFHWSTAACGLRPTRAELAQLT